MKKIQILLLMICVVGFIACSSSRLENKIVEASCGQCQFGMKEKKGCDLAIRFEGESYFVTGTGIDDHGDAHAADGFCQRIRKAKVTGEIKDGVFFAENFELVLLES